MGRYRVRYLPYEPLPWVLWDSAAKRYRRECFGCAVRAALFALRLNEEG